MKLIKIEKGFSNTIPYISADSFSENKIDFFNFIEASDCQTEYLSLKSSISENEMEITNLIDYFQSFKEELSFMSSDPNIAEKLGLSEEESKEYLNELASSMGSIADTVDNGISFLASHRDAYFIQGNTLYKFYFKKKLNEKLDNFINHIQNFGIVFNIKDDNFYFLNGSISFAIQKNLSF